MKFLIIGFGSIGRRHTKLLYERRDIAVGVFDINKSLEREVKKIGKEILFFKSLEEALKWKPEIAIVSTPDIYHAENAILCMKAGINVLCEKPLADTVENGIKMVKTARKYKKVLGVGYSERFRPSIEYIEKLVRNGKLGNLVGGRAMVGTYNTLLCAKTDYYIKQFGSLLLAYTHEFDFLRAIFGEVEDIKCYAHNLGKKKLKANPSLAVSVLKYKNGSIVSVHMDYLQHPQRRSLEVFGDLKTVELDLQTDIMKMFSSDKEGYQVLSFDPDRDTRIKKEHQDFINAVKYRRKPRISGEEGLKALEIAEKAIKQIEYLKKGKKNGK